MCIRDRNISALFSQRQRWAEGGLQRFFDYGEQLFSRKIELIQKFDLTYFFILQYALPIISMIDLILSITLAEYPCYWPISITAFTLSGIAVWYGSSCKSEGPTLQNLNLMMLLASLVYLSHWFIIIPWVTIKMSIFPKKILWKKTIHTCLLYTSPSPRDLSTSRMPSSA